jgi:membrane-bound lytic murein transglycosylase C
VERKTVTGSDNVQREVVRVSFPLAPDHLRVRAERFRPYVDRYAKEYGVYPPLVYAIIHSESSFNPRARSGVPAFGLMQLVPRSGARDAYLLVYKKDRMVSDTYLYNPERNIELGTAYLHILQDRYFRRVESPMNRMLCAIAGYNTGAGNVCKAFGAGASLTRAAPVINGMTPEQVYNQLRTQLPYEETRKYIVKVNDRLPLYREWQ